MEFLLQFAFWLLAVAITLGVIATFELATVTGLLVLAVAGIWAVLIWGGFFILIDGDFF
jgi:Na+/H+ antiporter NhaC